MVVPSGDVARMPLTRMFTVVDQEWKNGPRWNVTDCESRWCGTASGPAAPGCL